MQGHKPVRGTGECYPAGQSLCFLLHLLTPLTIPGTEMLEKGTKTALAPQQRRRLAIGLACPPPASRCSDRKGRCQLQCRGKPPAASLCFAGQFCPTPSGLQASCSSVSLFKCFLIDPATESPLSLHLSSTTVSRMALKIWGTSDSPHIWAPLSSHFRCSPFKYLG